MVTRQQKLSRQQERKVAEDVDGRVQKGSGSHWSAKSDVRQHGHLRVECKVTEAQVYRLRLADLLKIQREALRGMDEGWVFVIEFRGLLGFTNSYAILDRALWNEWGGNMVDQASIAYTAVSKSFLFRRDALLTLGRGVPFDWMLQVGGKVLHFAVVPWSTYLSMRKESP